MNFRNIVMSAIAAGSIGFALPAYAQETVPTPSAPLETPSSAEISEDTLQSFAVAFLEVAKVSQEYQPQLESATTPEDQQQVRTEAGERMIEAVEATNGISVGEYQEIIQAAQVDPELAQRINTHISQAAQ